MTRLAWYAGASATLAGAVVASAFHQRANFYSAMVHLAQSSLSLLILVNLVLLVYGYFMYGLQRLCFGQLRPVEIEQLYEKAWFAVTETCLAMTIFREEVGAFFLVMFTALVTGKVWGWISEGRVEVLEQQPPANPRLFHTRLSISLIISFAYDLWLLNYAVNTVVQQARPTMMVMFLFEFAVLTISSAHTGCRYIISLVEARVIRQQTAQRLEDRRRQVREQRAEILRRRETEGVTETESEASEPLPREDEIDEMDIEVPGWESKGQWVLGLDLLADFIKMGIYTAFFCVLFTFYGLPIHIMRDVFMTTRSFVKRLNALLRYRQAVRDMNKYPDATAEDLGREDTCIICREEMHPWDPANPGQVERYRPKKLPCGHILHFGCLKSWLERQQVCPTCRRSVVMDAPPPARNGDAMVLRFGLNFPGRNPGQQPPANGAAPGNAPIPPAPQGGQGGGQNDQQGNRNGRVRMFQLGPIRLGFAQGGPEEMLDMAQQMQLPTDAANAPATVEENTAMEVDTNGAALLEGIRDQLADINQRVVTAGQRVQQDMQQLQIAEAQLSVMHMLLHEMARLNNIGQAAQQQQHQQHQQHQPQTVLPPITAEGASSTQIPTHPLPQPPQQPQAFAPNFPTFPTHYPQTQPFNAFAPRAHTPTATRHGGASFSSAIPAGSPDLPEGVVIPQGWTLLPLQRLDGGGAAAATAAAAAPPQQPPPAPLSGGAGASHHQVQAPRPVSSSTATAGRPGPGPGGELFFGDVAAPARPVPTPPPPTVLGGLRAPVAAGIPPRVAVSEAAAAELEQRQRGRSPPAVPSSSRPAATAASPTEPEPQIVAAAPTPVLPNWGGASQLFGRSAGGASGSGDAAASSVQEEQHQKEGDDGAAEKNETPSSTAVPAADKGKARAVTIEDDDDENDT